MKRGDQQEGQEQGKMQGQKQLEEGENAKGRICVANLDHLGHLDERLELVLGDCRREFQCSLSSRKLNTIVGEYGSFLRTQVPYHVVLGTPSLAPAGVPGPHSLFEELKVRVPRDASELVPDRFVKVSPIATEINGHIQTSSNCLNHSVQDPNSSSGVSSPDRSPNSMIHIFTSHVIPGGGLVSPLIPGSGLHLMKKRAEGEGLDKGNMPGKKELEEGDVCLADLDHLDHLNERLELVLRDYRKFQGSLSSRKLSTTVGEHGSFLRTHMPGNVVLTNPSLAPAGVPGPPWLFEELKVRAPGDASELVPDRFVKISPIATEINGHMQTSFNCFSDSLQDPDSSDVSSPDRSPNSMIQIFTSHVIPEGGLLSPLILGSGLHLVKKGAEGEGLDRGNMPGKKELEEGEVCIANLNHVDHLNEMLELVSRDFRKEFQGSPPSRKLSTTVGGYGSFLITQVPNDAVLNTPSLTAASVPGLPCLFEELKVRVPRDGSEQVPERLAKVSPFATEMNDHMQTSSNCFNHSLQDPEWSSDVSSPERSPYSMIQIFTSHVIPGGGLLSPLILGSGLHLMKKGPEGEGRDRGTMLGKKELEEGEVCLGDLDHLNHLNERLELVLGDCRKEFQGSLSSRKLSTTVGESGSSLRTQVPSAVVLTTPSLTPVGVPGPPSQFGVLKVVPGDVSELLRDRFAKVSPIATEINGHMQTNSSWLNYSVQDPDPSSGVSSPDRSPNSMIQIFTSHVIPEGGLLSPLILGSGLHLMKKGAEGEGLDRDNVPGKKELEEGEVCLADLDHLDHLNEKFELVSGDFRKEFQGSLPSRKLSTTAGESGSSLRAQVPNDAVLTTFSHTLASVPEPPCLFEELKVVPGDVSELVRDRFAKVYPIATEINGHTQTNSNFPNHSVQDSDSSSDVSSPDRSPNSMIQIFTSHVIPEGGLLSPFIETYSMRKSGIRLRKVDLESDHQVEKRRVFSKFESNNCGASAAGRLLAERLGETLELEEDRETRRDDRSWKDCRETRTKSTNYYAEMGSKYRDELYRKRGQC